MSQANLSLANAAGAIFRAALNAAIGALVTNNSGATEPSPTYPNMWWYDTANAQLKRRNNANDAWIVLGLEAASTDGTMAANSDSLVPTQKAAKTYADTKIAATVLDTDGTLAANSDAKIATQKASKTYADGKLSKTTTGEIAALTEKTTLADDDLFIIEDSAASNAKKKVKKSNISSAPTGASYIGSSAGTLLTSLDAARTLTSVDASYRNAYHPLKAVTVLGCGSLYVSFTVSKSSDDICKAQIFINETPTGIERTIGSPATYSEAISGIRYGDILSVRVKVIDGGGTDTVTVSNFRIYYNTVNIPRDANLP
jgi:hypothetical protein